MKPAPISSYGSLFFRIHQDVPLNGILFSLGAQIKNFSETSHMLLCNQIPLKETLTKRPRQNGVWNRIIQIYDDGYALHPGKCKQNLMQSEMKWNVNNGYDSFSSITEKLGYKIKYWSFLFSVCGKFLNIPNCWNGEDLQQRQHSTGLSCKQFDEIRNVKVKESIIFIICQGCKFFF